MNFLIYCIIYEEKLPLALFEKFSDHRAAQISEYNQNVQSSKLSYKHLNLKCLKSLYLFGKNDVKKVWNLVFIELYLEINISSSRSTFSLTINLYT